MFVTAHAVLIFTKMLIMEKAPNLREITANLGLAYSNPPVKRNESLVLHDLVGGVGVNVLPSADKVVSLVDVGVDGLL